MYKVETIMKLFQMITVSLMILGLTGCFSTATWNKSGVSAYNTNNQLSKCRYEIGLAKVSKEEKQELLSDCMRAEGFRYN